MKLKNDFTYVQKVLFIDHYWCVLCERSDLGIQAHHIVGRSSNSPFNLSPVCYECHSKMCHSQEEEQALFDTTFKWLYYKGYKATTNDLSFISENYNNLEYMVSLL